MHIHRDYAILAQDSSDTEINLQPLTQQFLNFSNLLQAEKERQKSKVYIKLDINQLNQSQNIIKTSERSSPRNLFSTSQVPSVEKIMNKMQVKHISHHQPLIKKEEFYDRQMRWLNQIKHSIQAKSRDKISKEIQECSFKPYKSPQQQFNKENKKNNQKNMLSPKPFKKPNKRNDSYSKIHLAKKQSLG